MPLLAKDHYEDNILAQVTSLEARIAALERTELSGVAGPQGPAGPTGAVGPTGATGPTGHVGGFTLLYEFDINTSAPPSSGTIRLNNATYASATTVWVHDSDRNGVDVSAILAQITTADYIRIYTEEDSTDYALYDVTSVTDSGAYYTLGIAARGDHGAIAHQEDIGLGIGFQGPSGSVGGSGTSGYVPKWTAATTLGNSIIYDDGAGKVGIGTTSPQRLLDLFAAGSTEVYLRLSNGDAGTGAANGLHIGGGFGSGANWQIWNYENGYLRFGTNNAQRMLIANNGDVGILCTPSGFRLDVAGRARITSDAAANTVVQIAPTSGSARIFVRETSTNQLYLYAVDTSGNVTLQVHPEGNSFFSGGKLGIGTDSPDDSLDIEGGKLRITQTAGTYVTLGMASSRIDLQAAGISNNPYMRMSNNAVRFGIGSAADGTYGDFGIFGLNLYVQGHISILDGVSAPSTVAGRAFIYVDSADGDLKVKFGDGTVKTLATDS